MALRRSFQKTVMATNQSPTSEDFDVTTRNIEHPFRTNPFNMQVFNQADYAKLKLRSRYYREAETSFDIVGNSFK